MSRLRPQNLLPTEESVADSLIEEPGESDTVLARTISTRYRVLKVELAPCKGAETVELKRKEKLRHLARLAVSKQMFGASRNRLIAYNYPTVMGLVSVGTSASLAQPLTPIIETFRHAVDTTKADGDTSL